MCKRWKSIGILIFMISFFTFGFILSSTSGLFILPSANAQYWQIMPPYNVLWPLYLPGISPTNPATGLPTPLVGALTKDTILPVQPCLIWEPSQTALWALYNTPATIGGGLLYFDSAYGLNSWPPPYLQDPVTGVPNPVTFLGTWSLLKPIDPAPFFIATANSTYALTYGISGQAFLDLLTASQILGLPPITPF
ncbi:MAG: hypothetical protein ACMUJM_14205 [bacterium]